MLKKKNIILSFIILCSAIVGTILCINNNLKQDVYKRQRMGGSQVYLKEGEVFTVEELLKACLLYTSLGFSGMIAVFLA